MSSPGLRQYAVLVAIGTLVVIALGAYVTSEALVSQPAAGNPLHATVHRFVAIVVGFLVLVLTVWQWLAQEQRDWGWAALCTYVLDGWLGWMGWAVLHASLAPPAFAVLVVIVVVMSRSWSEAPEVVDGQAAPLLRPLALAAPLLVLLQILLGAAYRHKVMGVMPHLGGAMIASLATLVPAMLILQQYPKHRALRSAAVWMMSILLTQIVLGVAAFTMQLLDLGNSAALVIAATAHVVVGSLTFAASLILSMQVQRNVRRAPAVVAAESTPQNQVDAYGGAGGSSTG